MIGNRSICPIVLKKGLGAEDSQARAEESGFNTLSPKSSAQCLEPRSQKNDPGNNSELFSRGCELQNVVRGNQTG